MNDTLELNELKKSPDIYSGKTAADFSFKKKSEVDIELISDAIRPINEKLGTAYYSAAMQFYTTESYFKDELPKYHNKPSVHFSKQFPRTTLELEDLVNKRKIYSVSAEFMQIVQYAIAGKQLREPLSNTRYAKRLYKQARCMASRINPDTLEKIRPYI